VPASHGRRWGRSTLALIALLAALAFAIPTSASASEIVIDSSADETDAAPGGACETAAADCTLRAAIEAANVDPDSNDLRFDPGVFQGGPASTIALGSALPTIATPVRLLGTGCPAGAGGFGPCAGIAAPDDQPGLTLESAGTVVEGLAITGGSHGIRVINATAGSGAGDSPPRLIGNEIDMVEGTGIESRLLGAEILGNEIVGALKGIHVKGDTDGAGNLIEGNEITESGEVAIYIENDSNEVFGNAVHGAGESAVYLVNGADKNRIGGDTPASENVLSGSTNSPVTMVLPETSHNEVARNRGSDNKGNFISLSRANSFEANTPGGGVKAPSVTTATESYAIGSGPPAARIRVFRKASEAPGELQSFVGEAIVDGGGVWSLSYAPIPPDTFLAVSATNSKKGTSELGFGLTVSDPRAPGDGDGGAGRPDLTPPNTRIAAQPALRSRRTAKLEFTSTIAGSGFECKLDKRPFAPCRSPKTYRKLKAGRHVFKVRALSPAGVPDPTPATKRFRVNL
jgi:CSLREA domain-containing protein